MVTVIDTQRLSQPNRLYQITFPGAQKPICIFVMQKPFRKWNPQHKFFTGNIGGWERKTGNEAVKVLAPILLWLRETVRKNNAKIMSHFSKSASTEIGGESPLFQQKHLLFGLFRQPFVVVIKECNPFASSISHPDIARFAAANIFLQLYNPETRISD